MECGIERGEVQHFGITATYFLRLMRPALHRFAVVAIDGVIAYVVSQRTREILHPVGAGRQAAGAREDGRCGGARRRRGVGALDVVAVVRHRSDGPRGVCRSARHYHHGRGTCETCPRVARRRWIGWRPLKVE